MTRNVAIALLVGILLGVIGTHQSAKAVQNDQLAPGVTTTRVVKNTDAWPVPHTGGDVLQEDLHRHEVMLRALRVCLHTDAYYQGKMSVRDGMHMLLQCMDDYTGR